MTEATGEKKKNKNFQTEFIKPHCLQRFPFFHRHEKTHIVGFPDSQDNPVKLKQVLYAARLPTLLQGVSSN